MNKRAVAVLFGGNSSEHEISRLSATSVLKHIPQDRYEVVMVGITKDGRWFYYPGPVDAIENGDWEKNPGNRPAYLSPDAAAGGLVIREETGERILPIDVVFPVLHGKNGEDGTIQGLLSLAGIPFVGCSCAASALTMDKIYTNMALQSAGIPQAKWTWCRAFDYKKDPEAVFEKVEKALGYPVFVKPANAGSSVGVGKAVDRAALARCIEAAAACDERILFEEAIVGKEVECAVLGNEEPVAATVGEIVPCNEFYDYEAKYQSESELHIPARLSKETIEEIRRLAVEAFLALGCEGMARVDFFVRESDGAILLNEPNTIPGFTSISMYPKLFEAAGLPYPQLLSRLIELGLERACR